MVSGLPPTVRVEVCRGRTNVPAAKLGRQRKQEERRALIEIKDRTNGQVLHTVDARTLEGAALGGLRLRCADFTRTVLAKANLAGSDLEDANFTRSNLAQADLSGANLIRANFSSSALISANLSGADLASANLKNANLFEANLSEANLEGARLSGADLVGADMSNAELADAVYDEGTRWPEGFDPRSRGAILLPDA